MLNFKPLSESDLEFLLEIRNDLTTRNNLENDTFFKIEECIHWFQKTKPKWYIIQINNTNVGYFRTNGSEIGCDIHPLFRRKGFARQAYEYYLKSVGNATLWVFDDNFAKNLYVSLGFVETGSKKNIRNRSYIQMVWNQ
jgi:hypothetical protein